MKNYRYVLPGIIFCMITLNACDSGSTGSLEKDIYFNLTVLIDEQVQLLDSLNPQVDKHLESNGVKESKALNIEKWGQELYLFKDADINKIAFDGLYQVEESSEENLKVKKYRAANDNLSTRELTVTSAEDKIKTIQIQVNRENILYATQKSLQITFIELPEIGTSIKEYKIQGNQSSIFGHQNDFDIVGEINYN